MAVEFEKLQFKKNWNNASDFPTYEENEAQVRADLQALHDETKAFINEKLIPGIENLAVPGAGDMKADVYDPRGKRLDVFRFAEDKTAEAVDALRQHIDNQSNPHKVMADQVQVTENVVNAFKETGNWSVDGILTQIGSTLFGGAVLYQWTKQRKELWQTGQTSITYEFTDPTKQYIFTVDVLAVGCTLGAEDAVIAGKAVGALNLNDLAVLDVGINTALRAGGTDVADSVANFDSCFFTGDLCFYESLQFSHGRHLRSIQ